MTLNIVIVLTKIWRYLMNKLHMKLLPFISVMMIFIILFVLSFNIENPNVSSLFLGLSTNTLFILIALFGYELVVQNTKRKLLKEVFEYVRLKIDPDIFSIQYGISKLLYGNEGSNGSKIGFLFKIKQNEIITILKEKEFFGFQLFKISKETENYFNQVLENSFILSRLEDKHVLILIQLVNALKNLERSLLNLNNLYILKDKEELQKKYKVIKGTDINPDNITYPNRYILLKQIDNEKGIVEDSGDFRKEDIERLIGFYAIKPAKLDQIGGQIYTILELVRQWIKLSDGKLLFKK